MKTKEAQARRPPEMWPQGGGLGTPKTSLSRTTMPESNLPHPADVSPRSAARGHYGNRSQQQQQHPIIITATNL